MLSQRNLASNAAATADAHGDDGERDAALHPAVQPHLRADVRPLHVGLPRLAAGAGRKSRDARARLPAGAADGAQRGAVSCIERIADRVRASGQRRTAALRTCSAAG